MPTILQASPKHVQDELEACKFADYLNQIKAIKAKQLAIFCENGLLDHATWCKKGKPQLWESVEVLEYAQNIYEVWLDGAYGYMAVFINGKLTAISKKAVYLNDVVVLNKHLCEINRCIWANIEA